MISQNAKKHADACRFCWMCRHLCPVGQKTGREINTPRGKGLLLSLVERGTAYDADMARAMYECLLCDACSDNCATGFEPPVFIREGRTAAVAEGLAPESVVKVLENIEHTGNIYGEVKPSFGDGHKAAVLVYIGEVAACRAPDMAKALLSLLNKAGIDCTVLAEEPASGLMLGDLIGYVEEVRAQVAVCAGAINEVRARTVVVLDSYDAVLMKQMYPEWGVALNAGVVTATSYVAGLIADGKLHPGKAPVGPCSYHDDSRLARNLREYDAARDIIASMGIELWEMFRSRGLAKCCGTSLVRAYMPDLSRLIAQGRWKDFARTGAKTLLVANPQVWEVLSAEIPERMELRDLFGLLNSVC